MIESIKEWTGSPLIGDDCAVLPGGQLATVDALVEGTHFLKDKISPTQLGWKTVAVNMSDVASMAGRPRYILLSATLPKETERSYFSSLYQSITECARTYKVAIAGGDVTQGPVIVLSVTVLADVHENGCLLRSGARPGDCLVVTGDFGASAAGLWLIKNEGQNSGAFPRCMEAHLRPLPRLCDSWSLVRKTGSRGALMDASDGLADALIQIARASSVGLEVDLEKLPIDRQTKIVADLAGVDPINWALYGGEDYELVGCLPKEIWQNWTGDNPFIKIGTVTEGDSVKLTLGKSKVHELDLSRCFEQIHF